MSRPIGLKNNYNKSGSGRTYSHNTSYFSKVTNESCYWAGFIAADGHIREHPFYRISIKLSFKDKSHLENFVRAINYTGPYRERKDIRKDRLHKSVVLQLSAHELIEGLKEVFNITHNKSRQLLPPNLTEESHIISYIVGFIDGDGGIGYYKCGTVEKFLELKMTTSTSEILEWIKYWFDKWEPVGRKGLSNVNKYKGENCYRYKVSGARALRILTKLGFIELPRLSRKWSIYG